MLLPILDIKATEETQLEKIFEEVDELKEAIQKDYPICRKLEELLDVMQSCFTMSNIIAEEKALERAAIEHSCKLRNRDHKIIGVIKIEIMGV